MALKLCGFSGSNYHNKIKQQLFEKGVPFEEELVWTSQDEALLARSPMGKVPFLEVDGRTLTESLAIAEYIEETYPEKPLLPRDPFERAKVRELTIFLDLHVEQVIRRLYPEAFFGGKVSDSTKRQVEEGLAKGLKALMRLARFAPFAAGPEFTLADCAAIQHLPLVPLATKRIYGRDFLEPYPQIPAYLKEMGQRPATQKVAADRKANQKLLAERAASK